ncbi:MAG: FtsW/RodA/SpoVE family cell cycle protein [Candidatus Pseudobacter hemicellulosilyticus]|uniref:FtsW/RodA/SpoVE family cell cycle protein n=1 Tax=Candidatus Pseudobacter hemicellulosilyticus TaxID=3121375 RepID=A0AAJ5WPH7_9BACT|nr:MAG: FtsW/RodA/SpoVE family cell cycle protein [Pseudobacter sp.]
MHNASHHTPSVRGKGWLLLTGAACLLALLFFLLFRQLKPQLDQAAAGLQRGAAIQLEPTMDRQVLDQILVTNRYFTDPRDRELFSDSLTLALRRGQLPENLGALNKKGFAITAPIAWQSPIGGADFQQRLTASRQRLGFDSALYAAELHHPRSFPATLSLGPAGYTISGTVKDKELPMSGVLVQLLQHIATDNPDSLTGATAYARTNAQGHFVFSGLTPDSAYSVLPMKPGLEFGSRQGNRRLSRNTRYLFTAQPHTLRLLGTITYSQLKEDGSLLIRTPEAFTRSYQLIAGLLLLGFFLAQGILHFRRQPPDPYILPIALLLCGVSILLLFSIQDPLLDTLLAYQTLQGVLAGLAGFLLLSTIHIGKWYARWWFDPLANFRSRRSYQSKGWTWLAMAIGLALLTAIMGSGPEGSGVKVNLVLGGISFQPSEITKYLLLFFLAGFFAANADKLRSLSDIRWRFLLNWGVLAGIAILLVLYLLMGDMGPALVLCFTFLFFYSIARGNLWLTLLTGIVYCLLLVWLPGWIATAIAFGLVILTLLFQGQLRSTRWYGALAAIADAPVILLLVMTAFTFGDQLPGIGQRLADRKAMWLQPWNNDVFGGDHLAHSYWTLSAGGFSGQGIGKGFPNTMPAAHTDMILSSIGEELGWIGLVSIFGLFALLLYRIFVNGRRSGQPFSFYICAGIAISIGCQLLLIAGGAFGLLPLTGVAVPFLSYGKISLIVNLAALGLVAGISGRQGQQSQQTYIRQQYDPVLVTGILFFIAGMTVLVTRLFFIQVLDRKEYLVKQSRVVMRSGLPVYSYNPRIDKLMRLLAAGTIYDRKGLVLATSEQGRLQQQADSLRAAGLDPQILQDLQHSHKRRLYPFGDELFFWTGDFNTRLFWGQQNGYYAESRHLTALRGFGISREWQEPIQTLYQPDRFTKPIAASTPLARYDYTPLIDGLAAGIDPDAAPVRAIREKDRNLTLSVDAALQVELQDSLQSSAFANRRIAVVVLDAASGELLASALHPLPNTAAPELLELPDRQREQLSIPVTDRDLGMTYATAPGSTAKILTAMAGLNKLGTPATDIRYNDIYRAEIFRDNKNEQEPFVPKVAYVDMHEAIVNSSNIYFIRLANDNNLEEQMAALYEATGMFLLQKGGYAYTPTSNVQQHAADLENWRKNLLNHDRKAYSNPLYAGKTRRYRSDFSGLAWGQSVLTSTPASMARMAGAIANNGSLQPSRYVLAESGIPAPLAQGVHIAQDTASARLLRDYMIDQSNPPGRPKIKKLRVAGKTGTPERVVQGVKTADGWYVFFAPVPGRNSCTVACVRIEGGESSANAVTIGNTVAAILEKRGYMESFQKEAPKATQLQAQKNEHEKTIRQSQHAGQ